MHRSFWPRFQAFFHPRSPSTGPKLALAAAPSKKEASRETFALHVLQSTGRQQSCRQTVNLRGRNLWLTIAPQTRKPNLWGSGGGGGPEGNKEEDDNRLGKCKFSSINPGHSCNLERGWGTESHPARAPGKTHGVLVLPVFLRKPSSFFQSYNIYYTCTSYMHIIYVYTYMLY